MSEQIRRKMKAEVQRTEKQARRVQYWAVSHKGLCVHVYAPSKTEASEQGREALFDILRPEGGRRPQLHELYVQPAVQAGAVESVDQFLARGGRIDVAEPLVIADYPRNPVHVGRGWHVE